VGTSQRASGHGEDGSGDSGDRRSRVCQLRWQAAVIRVLRPATCDRCFRERVQEPEKPCATGRESGDVGQRGSSRRCKAGANEHNGNGDREGEEKGTAKTNRRVTSDGGSSSNQWAGARTAGVSRVLSAEC
jgi:hypothetical protein